MFDTRIGTYVHMYLTIGHEYIGNQYRNIFDKITGTYNFQRGQELI
jgi:hypothetical protein